jgi:hypothetical protein
MVFLSPTYHGDGFPLPNLPRGWFSSPQPTTEMVFLFSTYRGDIPWANLPSWYSSQHTLCTAVLLIWANLLGFFSLKKTNVGDIPLQTNWDDIPPNEPTELMFLSLNLLRRYSCQQTTTEVILLMVFFSANMLRYTPHWKLTEVVFLSVNLFRQYSPP